MCGLSLSRLVRMNVTNTNTCTLNRTDSIKSVTQTKSSETATLAYQSVLHNSQNIGTFVYIDHYTHSSVSALANV